MTQCKLWKITLIHDAVVDEDNNDLVFWGYHMSEAQARDAALRWGEAQKPGSRVTILKVELQK